MVNIYFSKCQKYMAKNLEMSTEPNIDNNWVVDTFNKEFLLKNNLQQIVTLKKKNSDVYGIKLKENPVNKIYFKLILGHYLVTVINDNNYALTVFNDNEIYLDYFDENNNQKIELKHFEGTFEQVFKNIPEQPIFNNFEQERLHRKQRLAAGYRIFAEYGYDDGFAGHITVRDPEFTNTFWVNPMGVHFNQITVSKLIRINHKGEVLDGVNLVNTAAAVIHTCIHEARPDVIAAAHSHSVYGRTWSTLGRKLDPITQDSCAFYNDHGLYKGYGGAAVYKEEAQNIVNAIKNYKAVILQNHGLITVGKSVDSAIWWYITLEESCRTQLLAESTNIKLNIINNETAEKVYNLLGTDHCGWFQFQPLYESIISRYPELLL